MLARFVGAVLISLSIALPVRAQESPTRTGTGVRPGEHQLPSQLPVYNTRYYVIHTDLHGDELREAALRMTRMFEEYHNRTRDFSGTVGHKFPFYLFRNPQDYYAAGGIPSSAGFFDPNNDTLSAIAGEKADRYTWQTIQHEGFHQYAKAVIGGELPTWVNEGLAEYFGEAVFTGDGFVSGVIPPDRLVRIKKLIHSGRGTDMIKEMMLMNHAQWNQKLTLENYDQAWSMVQFLAHGENGKYQRAFASFMRAIGTGRQWTQAWTANFGSASGFEQRWKDYWLKLPPDPTADLYAKATVETLTSILARTWVQHQQFTDFDAFASAGKSGQFKFQGPQWLPQSLISSAFEQAQKLKQDGGAVSLLIAGAGHLPEVQGTTKEGAKLTGHFTMRNGRPEDVSVDVTR
jgi:hypothetical protein